MNTGDTTWILISTALVLLMTPGLAFFYAGLVRERNAINTIKMSFIALGLIAVEWAVIGYSLAFGEGSAFVGGLGHFGLAGVGAEPRADYGSTVPHLAFMAFQMMFAIITPALISGSIVGRMRFRAYLFFILLWGVLIYAPLAHWVWGPGGWIAGLGALDFAGGTVVHISAGVSALVAALVLGPRRSRRRNADTPHNVPFVILGASLLWFGWIGFNAGSALGANEIAALALVNTILGAAAAMMAWVLYEMFRTGRSSAIGAALGAVVGLVAITPAAGFVTPMASIAIGAASSLISAVAMAWMNRTRLDDTLDVFACHGLGGVSGALLTGVFASTSANPDITGGLVDGNAGLLLAQLVGVLAAVAVAGVGTWVILRSISVVMALRTSERAELLGIDRTEHDELAYQMESQRHYAAHPLSTASELREVLEAKAQ